MRNTARACFICGGTSFRPAPGRYERCLACGHETLTGPADGGAIVNDRLDERDIDRPNALDRFKNAVVRSCARSRTLLLDVGSGSGRFLRQNAAAFERSLGIEVSPACVAFARSLGLRIEPEIGALREPVGVATFWHSLEHLPAPAIAAVLGRIGEWSTPETAVVVSVPNAASLQYALLGERSAFFDAPHHLHQFTPRSLDLLLERHGLERRKAHRSFVYAHFGWLQGLLNLCNSRHDYLYYRRKRGWDYGLRPGRRALLDAYNAVLAALFLAPSLALAVHDLLRPRRGGVLTVCYRTRTGSK